MVNGAGHTRPRRRRNLKDEVAAYLRQQIFFGGFKAGQKIDQDRVAAELDVSKLPVREALISLESEGLVDNIARRGAFVAELTPEDIEDHYAAYGTLVGLAHARACERITDADLEVLEKLVARMQETSDPAEQETLNNEFHASINRIGASRRLRSVLRTMAQGMPHSFYELNPEWAEIAVRDHLAILKALRGRDAESAAREVREHLSSGGEVAVAMLKREGFWEHHSGNQ